MAQPSGAGHHKMMKPDPPSHLAIVGAKGGSNIGESFWNAALNLGFNVLFFITKSAYS